MPWNWPYTVSSANTTTIGTWQEWNTAFTRNVTSCTSATTVLYIPQWQSWNFQYEEIAEQRTQREIRQREAKARNAECQQMRIIAKSRAEELLLAMLNDEQARDYWQHGWFEVRGSRGSRYRIRNRGQAGNVDLMPEIGNERDVSFCCHPPGGLPDADAHLAQMLHLVTDEDDFRRVANIAYRRPGLVAA